MSKSIKCKAIFRANGFRITPPVKVCRGMYESKEFVFVDIPHPTISPGWRVLGIRKGRKRRLGREYRSLARNGGWL